MIIQYDKKAKKFIEAQDRVTKKRIKTGIEGLTFNPPKGDIKIIQGYNDTLEHTATLYAVNRAQELSDPVEVKFYPKESPLSKAINIDSRGDIYKR